MSSHLLALLNNIGVEPTIRQLDQFEIYRKTLLLWNEKINLTNITEEEEVDEKHFADSATLVKTGYILSGKTLLDVGTGAGFPGVVLKIIEPGLKLTLLDALQKRITFLEALLVDLTVEGVLLLHGRAEDFAKKKEHREQYDIVTARAVAALPVLLEYCLPFVKDGGVFIAMKGESSEDEIEAAQKALQILGGQIESVQTVQIADSIHRHTLIVVKKIGHTSSKYPRKAGVPTKNPL